MFNVGGLELVAVAVVALVVLGPDRLPGALRQAGAVLAQVRRASEGVRIDVAAALTDDGSELPSAGSRVD